MMKSIKTLLTLATVVCCANLLFAKKPLTCSADELARIKIKQLNSTIVLTDSQRVFVAKKTCELAVKIQACDSTDYLALLPQYNQEYKIAIDSILTAEQKAQLEQKRQERINTLKASIRRGK